jgi:phosphatidylglycerophosphate synthase
VGGNVAVLSRAAVSGPIVATTRVAGILTIARVPIGAVTIVGLAWDWPGLGLGALVTFVLVDLLDGAVARRAGGGESAGRRFLDSAIDRSTVTLFFLCASVADGRFLFPALLISAVNGTAIPIAWISWSRARVVIRAPHWHKLWSLTMFAAGSTFFLGSRDASLWLSFAGAMSLAWCSGQLGMIHPQVRELGNPRIDS